MLGINKQTKYLSSPMWEPILLASASLLSFINQNDDGYGRVRLFFSYFYDNDDNARTKCHINNSCFIYIG